jgi:sulfate adenylyltransferase subunit 2
MDASILKKTIKTIECARKKNDACLLFFSGSGKDSIVLLHLLQNAFEKVYCVFLYIVKDLELLNPFFNWALSYKNVEIVQLPHPDYYSFKRSGKYNSIPIANLKNVSFRDIEEYLKKKYQTDIVVYGMKRSDSFVRAGMFNKAAKADIHFDYDKYYPIVNWKNTDCISYIKLHSLPIPLKLGSKRQSSGVNLRPDTILHIKKTYPNDYQRMVKEYDLIGAKYGSK